MEKREHVDTHNNNPSAAKALYICFQANLRLNKIPLKFVTYLVVDAQLI